MGGFYTHTHGSHPQTSTHLSIAQEAAWLASSAWNHGVRDVRMGRHAPGAACMRVGLAMLEALRTPLEPSRRRKLQAALERAEQAAQEE